MKNPSVKFKSFEFQAYFNLKTQKLGGIKVTYSSVKMIYSDSQWLLQVTVDDRTLVRTLLCSCLRKHFSQFCLFSCLFPGDDRELRTLEWGHWRVAAGELICALIISLNVYVLWCNSTMAAHIFFCNVSQKCVAYTGNNMRKQTPAPDKKEKDVSLFVF